MISHPSGFPKGDYLQSVNAKVLVCSATYTSFFMGFKSGQFADQSSSVIPWSLNQVLILLTVWPCAKLINTDWGNFTMDFKHPRICATGFYIQLLGPWFINETQN